MSPLVCVNAKNNRGVSRSTTPNIHPQIPLKTLFYSRVCWNLQTLIERAFPSLFFSFPSNC